MSEFKRVWVAPPRGSQLFTIHPFTH
jgi:hypothetical protein